MAGWAIFWCGLCQFALRNWKQSINKYIIHHTYLTPKYRNLLMNTKAPSFGAIFLLGSRRPPSLARLSIGYLSYPNIIICSRSPQRRSSDVHVLGPRSDTPDLKHVRRILGHYKNPALLVSHFQAFVFEHWTGDATPTTRQKGSDELLQCPRILLTCFRARISALDE